jgi:hypothetical protein
MSVGSERRRLEPIGWERLQLLFDKLAIALLPLGGGDA